MIISNYISPWIFQINLKLLRINICRKFLHGFNAWRKTFGDIEKLYWVSIQTFLLKYKFYLFDFNLYALPTKKLFNKCKYQYENCQYFSNHMLKCISKCLPCKELEIYIWAFIQVSNLISRTKIQNMQFCKGSFEAICQPINLFQSLLSVLSSL